jgi:hypothetical protein
MSALADEVQRLADDGKGTKCCADHMMRTIADVTAMLGRGEDTAHVSAHLAERAQSLLDLIADLTRQRDAGIVHPTAARVANLEEIASLALRGGAPQ